MIKAHEAMEQLATYRMMNAIGSSKVFTYFSTEYTFTELVPYKEFKIISTAKDIDKTCEEIIIPTDEIEGKRYHKAAKNPQNIYNVIIRKNINGINEYNILFIYEPGPSGKAAIELAEKVIDEFIIYMGFETLRDIEKYVFEYESSIGLDGF